MTFWEAFWPAFWANAKSIADTAQATLTCVGILVGFWWVLRKRERFPRATVAQRIRRVELADGKWLVRVETTLTNVGQVMMRLGNCRVRLQQIRPVDLGTLVDNDGVLRRWNDLEGEWATIEELQHTFRKQDAEIEPGEAQSFESDFLIDSAIEVVQVDSYFQNIKKTFWRRQIGWNATTISDLSERGDEMAERITEQTAPKPQTAAVERQLTPKPSTPAVTPPVVNPVPAGPSNIIVQLPPKPSTPPVNQQPKKSD